MAKIKTVYWSPMLHTKEDNNWNILFIEPERLLSKFVKDTADLPYDRIQGMKRCPAFTNLTRNTFYVQNPVETEFKIESNEVKFEAQGLFHDFDGLNISYGLSYLFFCEDDLELLMTSPYFSEAEYTKYAMVVPGKFNISKWFRPFNVEMVLVNNRNNFKIKEYEHIAYFTFLTDDKVVLKRFEVNDTLRKIATTCSTVSRWWKNVPLLKRYDRFLKTRTNRLVMSEIKKQLVL